MGMGMTAHPHPRPSRPLPTFPPPRRCVRARVLGVSVVVWRWERVVVICDACDVW